MSEVDRSQLMRYIELEKEIHELESQNVLKNYEVCKARVDDVAETIKSVKVNLEQLTLNTAKEKADVDKMMKDKSIGEIFQCENDFNKQLSKEQEEYLEALNKQETARQQLEGLEKQQRELEGSAEAVKCPAEKLKSLYEERDALLSDIFGGEYGSVEENKLEALFDQLMERKQRVSVANYKWTNARVLLQHAVNQMCCAATKWKDLGKIPPHESAKRYYVATEARNNNNAAIQNTRCCSSYLGESIQFPYCNKEEIDTLERATLNIYVDMTNPERHKHAHQCYDVTWKRAAALLQWFDNVIQNTIQKDLQKVTEEARRVEKDLRAERIRLIRDKVAESGGDVKGLTDAGLKGLTDGFSKADQTQISDEDKDLKNIGIARPAPVGDDNGIPDAQEMTPSAPTPLPLSEIAPTPCEEELFGYIENLKEEYKANIEGFQKAQDLNKTRQQQDLHTKLAARRHRKH